MEEKKMIVKMYARVIAWVDFVTFSFTRHV